MAAVAVGVALLAVDARVEGDGPRHAADRQRPRDRRAVAGTGDRGADESDRRKGVWVEDSRAFHRFGGKGKARLGMDHVECDGDAAVGDRVEVERQVGAADRHPTGDPGRAEVRGEADRGQDRLDHIVGRGGLRGGGGKHQDKGRQTGAHRRPPLVAG